MIGNLSLSRTRFVYTDMFIANCWNIFFYLLMLSVHAKNMELIQCYCQSGVLIFVIHVFAYQITSLSTISCNFPALPLAFSSSKQMYLLQILYAQLHAIFHYMNPLQGHKSINRLFRRCFVRNEISFDNPSLILSKLTSKFQNLNLLPMLAPTAQAYSSPYLINLQS